MPRTRQTARRAPSASVSVSASADISPIFSARTSEQSTPDTSVDGDLKYTVQTRRSTRAATTKGKKRARESDEEFEDNAAIIPKPAAKRARKPFVEISKPAAKVNEYHSEIE